MGSDACQAGMHVSGWSWQCQLKPARVAGAAGGGGAAVAAGGGGTAGTAGAGVRVTE